MRIDRVAEADLEALLPLMHRTMENGFELTGPIARGDEGTVERQRAAVAEAAPDLLTLWDALADETRKLAASSNEMKS